MTPLKELAEILESAVGTLAFSVQSPYLDDITRVASRLRALSSSCAVTTGPEDSQCDDWDAISGFFASRCTANDACPVPHAAWDRVRWGKRVPPSPSVVGTPPTECNCPEWDAEECLRAKRNEMYIAGRDYDACPCDCHGAAPVVGTEPASAPKDALKEFTDWFVRNYPSQTIIGEPEWHAPRIFRNASYWLRVSPPDVERETTRSADVATPNPLKLQDVRVGSSLRAEPSSPRPDSAWSAKLERLLDAYSQAVQFVAHNAANEDNYSEDDEYIPIAPETDKHNMAECTRRRNALTDFVRALRSSSPGTTAGETETPVAWAVLNGAGRVASIYRAEESATRNASEWNGPRFERDPNRPFTVEALYRRASRTTEEPNG